MNSVIRVTVVEDHGVVREALATLLNGMPGFACAGAHPTAEAALKALPVEKPHVLLLDLELPKMSGEELLRIARVRWPTLGILVLSVHDEPERIARALVSGANGYLVKQPPPTKLLDAIVDVAAGGAPMSSPVAKLVLEGFREQAQNHEQLGRLTEREAEILAALARGRRYTEIAAELGISIRTVSTHLHHIYQKLHVRSRTEAAARYWKGP